MESIVFLFFCHLWNSIPIWALLWPFGQPLPKFQRFDSGYCDNLDPTRTASPKWSCCPVFHRPGQRTVIQIRLSTRTLVGSQLSQQFRQYLIKHISWVKLTTASVVTRITKKYLKNDAGESALRSLCTEVQIYTAQLAFVTPLMPCMNSTPGCVEAIPTKDDIERVQWSPSRAKHLCGNLRFHTAIAPRTKADNWIKDLA